MRPTTQDIYYDDTRMAIQARGVRVQTETRVRPSCGALGTTVCGAAIYLGELFACRESE